MYRSKYNQKGLLKVKKSQRFPISSPQNMFRKEKYIKEETVFNRYLYRE